MKRDKQAQKESVWTPTTWKRSNFVFATVMMTLYLVTLTEFSYWNDFGTYIWYLLIGFRPMGILLDMIIEGTKIEKMKVIVSLDCNYSLLCLFFFTSSY